MTHLFIPILGSALTWDDVRHHEWHLERVVIDMNDVECSGSERPLLSMLIAAADSGGPVLRLNCADPRQLRIGPLQAECAPNLGEIAIEDVRSRQMEGIAWSVTTAGSDLFSVLASSVDLEFVRWRE